MMGKESIILWTIFLWENEWIMFFLEEVVIDLIFPFYTYNQKDLLLLDLVARFELYITFFSLRFTWKLSIIHIFHSSYVLEAINS